MMRITLTRAATALLLLVFAALPGRAGEKIKIEKLDDLPRHTYRLDVKAAALLDDDEALLKLAGEVRRDLEDDLAKYEITDATTLKSYYGVLGMIAFLEERYDDYLAFIEKRRQLEDKESQKLMTGLVGRSLVAAARSGESDRVAAFEREFAQLVNALPYEVVEADVKQAKGQAEIFSRTLLDGVIESRLQPVLDKSDGEMSKDIAEGLVANGWMVRHYVPVQPRIAAVYSAYLDAHAVSKPDIWAERDVTLEASGGKSPVVIAVWDSGVDTNLFPQQLWRNDNEIAGNDEDDDDNGYVDDVYGIAYTLHADKTPDLLYPVGDIGDRARLQRLLKGLEDVNANVDSEEATEIKGMLGQLGPDEVKPFLEDISKYGNYCHGTHVAGIAVRGNPLARILTARITFSHTLIPEKPTLEQARKDSTMFLETVEYFRRNGVRLVNMSWGGSLASIEAELEANTEGESPEERKKLAREIYEIQKAGLLKAFASAPEILFITSAGNADSDVRFEEFYPSSFDVQNIISVGAVDQAGDETDFTSFGKVDVYACGFEVESFVPGGDRMKLSGTSQASPNVTNLAGKLLALDPDLGPAELVELITQASEERLAGERPVRLIQPRKSVELLQERM
jgi:hypothetical protein